MDNVNTCIYHVTIYNVHPSSKSLCKGCLHQVENLRRGDRRGSSTSSYDFVRLLSLCMIPISLFVLFYMFPLKRCVYCVMKALITFTYFFAGARGYHGIRRGNIPLLIVNDALQDEGQNINKRSLSTAT